MLGVPFDTHYGWRHRGDGPRGYRVGRHFAIAAPASRPGWRSRLTAVHPHAIRGWPRLSGVAFSGVTARAAFESSPGTGALSGRERKAALRTKMRLVDAERRKAEIEVALAGGTWRDPRRGDMHRREWGDEWLPTRHDLRATTGPGLRPHAESAITNIGVRQ
jgi:hypothetical protein